jgi:hypothetical protein
VVRLHDWCFISIFQGVLSSPLRISDMINADSPVARKCDGRSVVCARKTLGSRTDIMAWEAVRTI